MQVSILGPVEVWQSGREVPVAGARLHALLARLAIDASHPVPTGALVEAVWPEEQPAGETNALQSLVSRLRRALGNPDRVGQSPAGYLLAVDGQNVDALRFEGLVSAGREAQRTGDVRAASETLQLALDLWRADEPAAGIGAAAATRLTELRLDALAERIEADLSLGRHAQLVGELDMLSREHPLREPFTGLLMTALAGSGRTADALVAYERLRAHLADELGIDPSTDLQQRHVAVLRGDVAAPQRAEPVPSGNLRSPLTTFHGRTAEVGALQAALRRDRLVTVLGPGGAGKTRLATEAAAAMSGAFADDAWLVELAPVTDPAEVPHAVLAQLGHRDSRLLDSRQPRPPREAVDQLLQILQTRQSLVVLDNCEHLLDAVAALADTLLARCPRLSVLTTSREPLGITGERLIPLPPLDMPPSAATVDEALTSPAVRLFADRAAAVRPNFVVDADTVAPVVEIVRRLDGLPLAIELAAARLRALPVDEIAARLSDRFRLLTGGSRTALPRHRTLHAVVQWSWDLLTAEEKLLAERLSVFPGGVTPDSAAAVTAPSSMDGAPPIDELLPALVDKSLLQLVTGSRPGPTGPRYGMLETIREFGSQRLADRSELRETRRRHAEWFAALCADAEPRLRRRGQLVWLRAMDAEHDNVLVALRTLIDVENAPGAVQLAISLSTYWSMQGRHAEAATWLGLALAVPGEISTPQRLAAQAMRALFSMSAIEAATRAGGEDPRATFAELADELLRTEDVAHPQMLVLAPVLLWFLGEHDRSLAALQTAVEHPDSWVRASGLTVRARFAENSGDVAGVRADCERALQLLDEIGDEWSSCGVLGMLSQLRTYDGDLPGALAALQQARDIRDRFGPGDSDDQLFTLVRLADLHSRLGRRDLAEHDTAAALELAERVRTPELLTMAYSAAAATSLSYGDVDEATQLHRLAEQHLANASETSIFGVDHGRALTDAVGAATAVERGELEFGRKSLATAIAAAERTRDMPICAVVAVVAGLVAVAEGQHEQAALLVGVAARLRGADDPTNRDLRAIEQAARASLGDEAYDRAVAEGRAVDTAEALRLLRSGQLPPPRLM